MTYVGKKPADIIATAVDTTTGTFSGDLTVDTNTLYVDSTNNRVGIGTSSPSVELSIAGSNPQLVLWEGTDGASSSKVQLGTGTVQGFVNIHKGDGTRTVQLNSDGDTYLNGGKVGIGTSSPSSYSSTTLEVKGSSTTSAIKMTNSTTGGGDAVGFDFEMNSNDMNFVNRTSSGVQKFWTNATERMRITSSGNVGIGTSSPTDVRLTLFSGGSGTAGQLKLGFDSNDFFQIGRNDIAGAGGGNFQIKPNGGTSIFDITSSGNVGIGTQSPSTYGKLAIQVDGTTSPTTADNVKGSSVNLYAATNGSATNSTVGIFGWQAGQPGIGSGIGFSRANGGDWGSEIRFYTHPPATSNIADITERMRIDSDGILLVGKTSTSTTVEGVVMHQDGFVGITRSLGNPLSVLRRDSDGDIIQFYRDTTKVGSIGVNTDLTIDGASGEAGIKLGNTSIVPRLNGSDSDNGVSLGLSNRRWTDLYLSGGVYLGGTGSANYLDDYEEGNWTPSAGGSLSVTGTFTSEGMYRKVGNIVTIQGTMQASSLSCSAASLIAGNLPFTASNTTNSYGGGTLFNNSGLEGGVNFIAPNSTDLYSARAMTSTTFIFFNAVYSTT